MDDMIVYNLHKGEALAAEIEPSTFGRRSWICVYPYKEPMVESDSPLHAGVIESVALRLTNNCSPSETMTLMVMKNLSSPEKTCELPHLRRWRKPFHAGCEERAS